MQSDIKNVTLGFKCDADWNSMPAANGGRHCNSCQKTVYDFTNAKANEFLQILSENNNNVCGRFKAEQVDAICIPAWQRWTSAALVLLGINLFHGKTYAQVKIKKADQHALNLPDDIYTGKIVAPLAEFPGGHKALLKFISGNIRYSKDVVHGKLVVSFIVKQDGSVGDITIIRHLSPVNDREIIRVLKSSPKWKPAKQDGKPVDSRYTLPVTFSKA